MECVWDVMLHAGGGKGSQVVTIPVRSGPNLATKRNEVLERYLAITEPELSGLLFVDTDILFTLDDVKRIIDSPFSITSGLYWNPSPDGGVFPVFNLGTQVDPGGSPLRLGRHEDVQDEPFLVAGIGMGFCFIRDPALRDLPPGPLWPFAEYVTPAGQPVSEDTGFCLRAAIAGYSIWVDPSIRVRHMKERAI
jgi:hypothetical protein